MTVLQIIGKSFKIIRIYLHLKYHRVQMNIPNKAPTSDVLSAIVFITMKQKRKSKDVFTLKALLDTGATGTIVSSKFCKHLKRHKCQATKWET